jgi:multidrug transporter EmrE-like cation transporter
MSEPNPSQDVSVSTNAPARRAPRLFNPYLTIAMSVVLDASAQMFLKIGATHAIEQGSWFGVTGLESGWVWLGIIAMITSLGSWIYSLRFVPLNIAANLAGVVHVLVPLSCWYFLHENISQGRWFGIILVIAGVFIIARPLMKVEEHIEESL